MLEGERKDSTQKDHPVSYSDSEFGTRLPMYQFPESFSDQNALDQIAIWIRTLRHDAEVVLGVAGMPIKYRIRIIGMEWYSNKLDRERE